MKRLTWEQKSKSSSGKKGYRHKVALFEYCYDACRPKSDTSSERWQLITRLPGIPAHLGNYATQEQAEVKAEEIFDMWLNMMGLTANA
jgi:hypothetical protein